MKHLRKAVTLLLALALLLSLAACGGETASTDPNAGVYEASSASMMGVEVSIADMYEKGFSIELKDKGKCHLNIDGTEGNGTWTLEDSVLHIKVGGLDVTGTIGNGVMTLENLFDTGLNLVLKRENAAASASPSSTPENKLAGHYPVFSVTMEGTTYDRADLVEMDAVDGTYLQLNADGTGELSLSGEEPDVITYDETSGLLTSETGETIPFTVEDGRIHIRFEEEDMTFVFAPEGSVSDMPSGKGGVAGSMLDAFGQGGAAATGSRIESPSYWYGWIHIADVWGSGINEGLYDAHAYVGTDDATGKPFFDVYEASDEENAVFSMFMTIEDDGTRIAPDIGDEDAWMLETYLSPDEDPAYYTAYLYGDGSLALSFDYENYDGKYGCTATMFFREYGAAWDEQNDLLPPSYESYLEALANAVG